MLKICVIHVIHVILIHESDFIWTLEPLASKLKIVQIRSIKIISIQINLKSDRFFASYIIRDHYKNMNPYNTAPLLSDVYSENHEYSHKLCIESF